MLHSGGTIIFRMKRFDRNDSSFPAYLSKEIAEIHCNYGKLLYAEMGNVVRAMHSCKYDLLPVLTLGQKAFSAVTERKFF